MEMNTVITISREYGSGGRDIGKLVAEKLDIPYYDQEITEIAAKKSGLNNEVLRENDEIATTSIFGNFMAGSYFFANQAYNANELTINDQLYLLESQIIHSLAEKGPCVIIGRCADYVLKDYDHVVSVFVHGPFDFCLEQAMKKFSKTEDEMRRFIQKKDKYRGDYYKYHTGQEWYDARNYDLCLDSSKLGFEGCVEAIKAYMKVRGLGIE